MQHCAPKQALARVGGSLTVPPTPHSVRAEVSKQEWGARRRVDHSPLQHCGSIRFVYPVLSLTKHHHERVVYFNLSGNGLFVPHAICCTDFQSPRIMASFFFRLQPLICCSADNASSRVAHSCDHNNSIGKRVEVYPPHSPLRCSAILFSRLSVWPV